jgi:hypothetical protein
MRKVRLGQAFAHATDYGKPRERGDGRRLAGEIASAATRVCVADSN